MSAYRGEVERYLSPFRDEQKARAAQLAALQETLEAETAKRACDSPPALAVAIAQCCYQGGGGGCGGFGALAVFPPPASCSSTFFFINRRW